jgi:transposase
MVSCKKTVFRSSATKSPRSGCNPDCGSDGRTVCHRCGSSQQNADYCEAPYPRQETARPLLDDIRSKIEAAQSAALPSSALSKACQYALALWKRLTRFLEYPELELNTNLAENSMRPVALGRKNWIHIGSPQAGPKVAAILSVVESCRRLQVPVRDYSSTILPGLADLPIRCLPDLTPAVWVARHS